jgi:class 3 adenylate cyclase
MRRLSALVRKAGKWLGPPLPVPLDRRALIIFILALAGGSAVQQSGSLRSVLDRPSQDQILANSPREAWDHVVVVAPDINASAASRLQLLPIYALAAERAVAAGAEAVFLDIAALYEPPPEIPYQGCLEVSETGRVRTRSVLPCATEGSHPLRCTEEWGLPAPMAMDADTASKFLLLPPVDERGPMVGLQSCAELEPAEMRGMLRGLLGPAASRKAEVVCAETELGGDGAREDGILRATRPTLGTAAGSLARRLGVDSAVDDAVKIARFGRPIDRLQQEAARAVLPLSSLASCVGQGAPPQGADLSGKVVILQGNPMGDPVDLYLTPASLAAASGSRFVLGTQVLADSIETLVVGDSPRPVSGGVAHLVVLLGALLGVLVGFRARSALAVAAPFLFGGALHGLGLLASPPQLLWPISGPTFACVIGVGGGFALHLFLGTARSQLVARYLPEPVRELLLQDRGELTLRGRRVFCAVLMSDIRGYTTLTDRLGSPDRVFALLNNYLEATTVTVQDGEGAWLEGYVGDEVCFYWPALGGDLREDCLRKAMRGALELQKQQTSYFQGLRSRPIPGVPPGALDSLEGLLGAGIGLACADVLMGNQGPPGGVQKFGILGEALNQASRLESLTKQFEGILVTEEFVEHANALGAVTRPLGRFVTTGREKATAVYAVGRKDTPSFSEEDARSWESWKRRLEAGEEPPASEAGVAKDAETMLGWWRQGLYDVEQDHWALTSK